MALYTGLSPLKPNTQMKKLLIAMECKDQRINYKCLAVTTIQTRSRTRRSKPPRRSDHSFKQTNFFRL